MGTDADAHSGVLVHNEKVVDMFSTAMSDADAVTVRDRLLGEASFLGEAESYNAYLPVTPSDDDENYVHAGNVVDLLKKVSSRAALENWTKALFTAVVGGETGKYSECWVDNEDVVEAVVNTITDVCDISLPSYELEAL